ncbi:unnamed protein product [Boreogadus saida]
MATAAACVARAAYPDLGNELWLGPHRSSHSASVCPRRCQLHLTCHRPSDDLQAHQKRVGEERRTPDGHAAR